jgi:pseudolysin
MKLSRLFVLNTLASVCISNAFAAEPIDLRHQSNNVLQPYLASTNVSTSQLNLKELRRSIDFNQITHIHLLQTYLGYPVWGSHSIVHIPKGSNTTLTNLKTDTNIKMNGTIYRGIAADVGTPPTASQADRALNTAIKLYQSKPGHSEYSISDAKTTLMIFVDKSQKAHWAYLVSFLATPAQGLPAKPTQIMDATTLKIYKQWDNIQTVSDVLGGGFGGNEKVGQYTYDSLGSNYSALNMQRDTNSKTCYLKNNDVEVHNLKKLNRVVNFSCKSTNPDHGSIYWDADFDAVNGAYSPSNDALFVGKIIRAMYQDWYGIPPLVTSNGDPMVLVMSVHAPIDNAFWNGRMMVFGDGVTQFYPLVSLGIGGHEISHGFTEQHSNLTYDEQSGGLNESFSDMAAKGAEFFANKHNDWEIGAEVTKDNSALRYMDNPTKDCDGKKPGDSCSIDNIKDYYDGLDVHYSSGVFNKAFYLIASDSNWNSTKKAFDIMVKANQDYWTADTTFEEAACGVLQATADYKYDTTVVKQAFHNVGIDNLNQCLI